MSNAERSFDFPEAAKAAGRILSRRIHSCSELRRKLRQKGFPGDVIEKLLAELQGQKLLNDANFAEALANELSTKGHGSRKIRDEMKKRGLDDEIIRDVMAKHSMSPDDELQIAREAFKRKAKTFEREPDLRKRKAKIFRFLASRGFSSQIIFKVIEESFRQD